jgi:hypothetical protein
MQSFLRTLLARWDGRILRREMGVGVNSPFSYSNWSPEQPSGGSEDCLETADTFNGTWNDRLCFRVLKFICEQE